MCKIGILFENRDFEHDVYELIKAFYPEAEIHTLYENAEAEYDLRFSVEWDNDSYIIKYERTENLSKQETEQKGVISADILSKENAGCGIQDAHALRKENKDNIKYALYQLLVKLTGRTLPWGNLTGIRPAKLAMGMIESGMKNTEAAREMRERYLVSPQKTALAITIANREREILKDIDYENGYSLYIGIPFCPSICLYCSFSSYPLKVWEKRTDEYVEALCREVRETALMMKGRKLDTIYIGGGTPTTLLPHQIRKLLDTVGEAFGYEGLAEFTVEAGRPDSITREKLMAIREYPVTRISVNPQTMNQETLDIIGAVRRYVDFNYRINIKRFRRRTANRRIRRQFDNAVVVFADAELLFGTHHAKTLHAADFADFQFLVITRNNDADRRKNTFQPLSAVWRTTNDLQLFSAGINRQQPQMIRIRMAFISFNFCRNKSV